MQSENQKIVGGEELTPRKVSKRMDRIRQASSVMGFPAIRSNASGQGTENRKDSQKHQVSLKNIAF